MSQPTAELLALADFNEARLDEDERLALTASNRPTGDEWEADQTEYGETELLVALRPDLPRPPDVMSGMWGAIAIDRPDEEDPEATSPLPQFQHAAHWDPARVLAEVRAKRTLITNWRQLILRIDAEPDPEKREHLALTRHGLDQVAYQLAAVHANHPDYKESWRP